MASSGMSLTKTSFSAGKQKYKMRKAPKLKGKINPNEMEEVKALFEKECRYI